MATDTELSGQDAESGESSLQADFQRLMHVVAEEVEALRRKIDGIHSEIQGLHSSKAQQDVLLTKGDAAELLSVSERTLDTLLADGEITSCRGPSQFPRVDH